MSAWVLQLLPTVQRYVGTGVGVIGDPTMNADGYPSLCVSPASDSSHGSCYVQGPNFGDIFPLGLLFQ